MTQPQEPKQRSARVYDAPPSTARESRRHFTQRVLITFGIAITLVLALWLLWISLDILLLIFAGVLLAVLLRGLSDRLSRWIGIPSGVSLAIVVISILVLIIGSGWMLAPRVAEQIDELREQLVPAVQQIQDQFTQYEWVQDLLERAPDAGQFIGTQPDMLAQATGIFSTTFTALLSFLIVMIVGVYLAVDPSIYRRGVLRLVPLHRRQRAQQVMQELGDTLWWWLIGRFISMTAVGIMTGIGLWVLGVPLAFTLGLLAAFLDFVPNIGPWLAAVPGVLLALLQSPTLALYVTIWYLILQQIESYLITPIVQQQTVKLPPVLTIFAQVLLTFTVGGLGLLLASPLAAVILVLVKRLYVEDVLGDSMDRPVETKA